MKSYYLFVSFLLMLLSPDSVRAQNRFQVSGYGSWAQGIMKLPGGNLLYVGYGADGGGGGIEAHAVKLASDGTIIWRKSYHMASGSKEYFFSCALLNDGTYMFAGSDDRDPWSFKNLVLVRTDSMGNQLNSYAYGRYGPGTPSNYASEARKVIATSDNKVLAVGNVDNKGYVLKTDYSGKVIWGKTYDSLLILRSVIETTDKNYVATGAGYGVGLIKLDTSGAVIWCKRYFGSPAAEAGFDVKQTPDGGFIMVGVTNGFQTIAQQGIIVVKTDSLGNRQWFKVYGAGAFFDYAYSIDLGSTGGYVVGGSTQQNSSTGSQGYAFGIDSIGNVVWSKQYTPNTLLSSVFYCGTRTSDQGYTFWGKNAGNLYGVKMDSTFITGCFEAPITTNIDTGAFFTGTITGVISIDSLRNGRNYPVSNMGQSFGFLCTNTEVGELTPINEEWVFPNPSEGVFRVMLPASAHIEVLNCIGERIFEYKNGSVQGQVKVDISSHKAGMYFIKAVSENETMTKKIIIH